MTKQKQNQNTKCQQLYVEGMHCTACKILVEKEFKRFKGVKEVKANIDTGEVEIIANKNVNVNLGDLNKVINQYGYTVHKSSSRTLKEHAKFNLKLTITSLFFAAVFAYIFNFLGKRAPADYSNVSAVTSYPNYFIFGLIAGVSTCAALVGGLLLGVSKNWTKKFGKSYTPHILFLTSRTISFLILGAFLGMLGSAFTISATFSSIIVVIVSIFMVLIGLQMIGLVPSNLMPSVPGLSTLFNKLEAKESKLSPVILGILTFFIPCGFTLIAQANALAMQNPTKAALSMFAFALGTLFPLIAISAASTSFYNNKKLSLGFTLFSGFLILILGVSSVNSQLNILGLPSLNDVVRAVSSNKRTEAPVIVGDSQLMQMEAKGFEYLPKEFNLTVGVPVRWEIYNSGALGCANAVYAPGLYNEVILLKPGLNVVEFTPEKAGNYKISCSMGMVPPVYVSVK